MGFILRTSAAAAWTFLSKKPTLRVLDRKGKALEFTVEPGPTWRPLTVREITSSKGFIIPLRSVLDLDKGLSRQGVCQLPCIYELLRNNYRRRKGRIFMGLLSRTSFWRIAGRFLFFFLSLALRNLFWQVLGRGLRPVPG